MILKKWIEIEFYNSNIKKYHKYFEEWYSNLCNNQLDGFNNQMIGKLNNSKVKH